MDALDLFGDVHHLSEQKGGHYVVPLLSFPPGGWTDPRGSPERGHLILRVISENSSAVASTSAQAEPAAFGATSTRSRSSSRHGIMSERPRWTPSEPRAWRKFLQELRRRRNLPVGRPADPALGDRARDRRAPIASRIRALDAAVAGQAAARHPDAPLALDTWPDSSAGCGRSGCTSSS